MNAMQQTLLEIASDHPQGIVECALHVADAATPAALKAMNDITLEPFRALVRSGHLTLVHETEGEVRFELTDKGRAQAVGDS